MSDSQEAERLKRHFKAVVNAIYDRRVIPFLGAGASVCDRSNNDQWTAGGNEAVPKSSELADHLAGKFSYPRKEKEVLALARVSQYAAITQGVGALYEELQKIFNKEHKPTRLHEFLASIPAFFRNKKIAVSEDPKRKRLIIFTTNYDDLLERAFDAANERYHKFVYMAAPMYAGKEVIPGSFLHFTPDKKPHQIAVPNEYRIEDHELPPAEEPPLPVIIKIHGAAERGPHDSPGSYVITEDHYIDYLVQTTGKAATQIYLPLSLPSSLVPAVTKSNYLFLGYSLQDWNIRVAWRRIWQEQKLGYGSWAVQKEPDEIDKRYWLKHNVDIYDLELADYVQELQNYMEDYNV